MSVINGKAFLSGSKGVPAEINSAICSTLGMASRIIFSFSSGESILCIIILHCDITRKLKPINFQPFFLHRFLEKRSLSQGRPLQAPHKICFRTPRKFCIHDMLINNSGRSTTIHRHHKYNSFIYGYLFCTSIFNTPIHRNRDFAEKPEEIDIRHAQEQKERAEERIRQKQSIQEYYHSQASLARAMNRLRVSQGKRWNL